MGILYCSVLADARACQIDSNPLQTNRTEMRLNLLRGSILAAGTLSVALALSWYGLLTSKPKLELTRNMLRSVCFNSLSSVSRDPLSSVIFVRTYNQQDKSGYMWSPTINKVVVVSRGQATLGGTGQSLRWALKSPLASMLTSESTSRNTAGSRNTTGYKTADKSLQNNRIRFDKIIRGLEFEYEESVDVKALAHASPPTEGSGFNFPQDWEKLGLSNIFAKTEVVLALERSRKSFFLGDLHGQYHYLAGDVLRPIFQSANSVTGEVAVLAAYLTTEGKSKLVLFSSTNGIILDQELNFIPKFSGLEFTSSGGIEWYVAGTRDNKFVYEATTNFHALFETTLNKLGTDTLTEINASTVAHSILAQSIGANGTEHLWEISSQPSRRTKFNCSKVKTPEVEPMESQAFEGAFVIGPKNEGSPVVWIEGGPDGAPINHSSPPIPRMIAMRGYPVIRVTRNGSVGSSPELFVEYFRSIRESSISEVQNGINLAKKLYPNRNIVLAGHSYGGLPISNWWKTHADPRVDRAFLFNPILDENIALDAGNSKELDRLLNFGETESNSLNTCSESFRLSTADRSFFVVQGEFDFLPRFSPEKVIATLGCAQKPEKIVIQIVNGADHDLQFSLRDATNLLSKRK